MLLGSGCTTAPATDDAAVGAQDATAVESVTAVSADWVDRWITADVHVHADNCDVPTDPTLDVVRGRMRDGHVQLVEVLRWGHEIFDRRGAFTAPATDPPPGGPLYEGFETSGIPPGATGHMIGLAPVLDNSAGNSFATRRSTVLLADDLHAASPAMMFGLAHITAFDVIASRYRNEGEPFEMPVHAARGLLSFVSVESMPNTALETLQPDAWTLMMNAGVHVALTAGVDYPCWVRDLGSVRTLARVANPVALDHAQFLGAIRARQTGLVDRSDDRVEYDLGSLGADPVALPADGSARLRLRWRTGADTSARIWFNGAVLRTVVLPAGVWSGEVSLRFPAGGWVVVTTPHTISPATWVAPMGRPFVPSADAACALVLAIQRISTIVRSGGRDLGADTAAALAAYDAAREHFEAVARLSRASGCM